jgi:hypothetical protein
MTYDRWIRMNAMWNNSSYLEVLCKLELEELFRCGQQEATPPAFAFTMSHGFSSGATWSKPKQVYMRVDLRDDWVVNYATCAVRRHASRPAGCEQKFTIKQQIERLDWDVNTANSY